MRGSPGESSVPWARATAERLLSGLGPRWQHVQGVAAAADGLLTRLAPSVDGDLVRMAAWLHDVGYAPSPEQTGFHPLDGARFLRARGAPEVVVSLVAHHTGAVFEAEQRGLAAALSVFAAPPQELLDVLTYADLTTAPNGAGTTVAWRLSEILARYEEGSAVHRAVVASSSLLLAAAGRVEDRLVSAGAQPR